MKTLKIKMLITILLVLLLGTTTVFGATICSPTTVKAVPFAQDGVGTFCFETTSLCTYINSWNLTTLDINGTSYLNTYVASSTIAPVSGKYIITYVSTVAWGHFEIAGTCGAVATATATTVTRTATATTVTRTATATATTVTRTATATRTSTTLTRTATATRTSTTVTRTATATTVTRTATATTVTRTATATGPTPTPPPVGTHLDNPFSGAKGYVNPEWSANASAGGGSAIANNSTAVWMDRIAAVTGGSGDCLSVSLATHLDRALAQGANLIIVVIYDMPNRDCSSSASGGELFIAADGVNLYKTQYIDPIRAIMAQSKYAGLRIVLVIEPDSLPNLVTNLSFPKCAEANSTGAYATCTQYALNQLRGIGNNIYPYIDIAHNAWLGWSSNFTPALDLFANIIKNTTLGVNSIDGFISNTANTLPFAEPFIPSGSFTVNGVQVASSRFFDWNPYTGDQAYMADWRAGMISRGFPSTIGMLQDTSRNGWGGPARPTAASTATDINVWVDATRIDRRYHRGNWCNQAAGIGARPQAAPATGVDAFVWIKPPGESDGQSIAGSLDPCDPNKALDLMCVPDGINTYCNCGTNGALPGAPIAGAWFQTMFSYLITNAYPAL